MKGVIGNDDGKHTTNKGKFRNITNEVQKLHWTYKILALHCILAVSEVWIHLCLKAFFKGQICHKISIKWSSPSK